MTPEIERIFHEIADFNRAERNAYFDAQAVDPAIRAEVLSLLDHDDQSTGRIASTILDSVDSLQSPASTKERCGPYVLTAWIGRGGMGSVYRAERVDGEVKQEAAIKLLRDSHDDPVARGRFLQERQILASLSHPNIARLLDAGHTASGRPFLAMELVQGKPIDEYCAALDEGAKIRLVLKLCDAVSYAHRNLVIHRDIKPNNILVTESGDPKLLDFGIARVLSADASLTSTMDRAFTPEYASPEQAGNGPVTTAADVFSLGAVLYKLLAGRAPHQFETRTPQGIHAAIRDAEITRPSRHNRDLSADLDAILMRALRKEQEKRYATVDEFAADLRAYLEHRPVAARRGEWMYEARKLARRHWIPLAAVTVAFAGLGAGLFFAVRQRNIAQRRFTQVRELSNRLFDVEERIRPLPGSIAPRQYIADVALGYLKGVASESEGDPELMLELANAYHKTAQILGRRGAVNLGKTKEAIQALEAGRDLAERVLHEQPGSRDALRTIVRIDANRLSQATTGERGSNSETIRRLDGRVEQLVAASQSVEDRILAHDAYVALHVASINTLDQPNARKFGEKMVESARRRAEMTPGDKSNYSRAASLRMYATFLRYEGELERSLAMFEEAEKAIVLVKEDRAKAMETGNIAYYKGLVLGETGHLSLGRDAEAIASLETCLRNRRQAMVADPNDHNSRIDFTQAALKQGTILTKSDPKRALAVLDDAYRVMSGAPADAAFRDGYLIRLDAAASYALRALNRPSEVRARLQRADATAASGGASEQAFGPMSHMDQLRTAQAEDEMASGFPNRSAGIYKRVLQAFEESGTKPLDDLADAYGTSRKMARLSEILRLTGDTEQATAIDRKRIDLWRKWHEKAPANPFVAALWHGIEKESAKIR